jgi:hypothetical protein
VLPADSPALEMKHILQERGFDVAGVQERPDGPVIGYVQKDHLNGDETSKHLLQLHAEHLMSDSTPIAEVLTALRSRERMFVVVGAGVRGIITRADLNKPPVRIYLFGLVSLLEMHLRFWVRTLYEEDSWQEGLKSNRLEAAQKLHQERLKRNAHISLLACLQFADLRELVLDLEQGRKMLGLGSKGKGKGLLEDAEELRNRLAHSQDELVEGKSWEELIDLVAALNAAVTSSDEAVEERALEAKNGEKVALWVSG